MWILWTAFFVSGVAGLSYELTWVRYLGQVFGATTPAVAATVAVFFGGMALGAWLGPRWLSTRARPALAYAGLEAAIGVMGAVLPWVFGGLEAVLAARSGPQSMAELLVASTVVLLVPTALLGATFPAMVAAVRERMGATRATAWAYGLNTLGAVAGVLLVSLWWLPSLGLRATSWTLAGLDFAVALGVVLFARRFRAIPPSTERREAPSPPSAEPLLSMPRALALAGGSGLLAIAIEVQWVRALALSFPATVYVFALVLAAYLVGLGIGASVIAARDRGAPPKGRSLLVAYALTALGCLLALHVLPATGPWALARLADGTLDTWPAYLTWVAGSSLLAMLPATVAMGAALPLLVGLRVGAARARAPSSDAARSRAVATVAGRIYAVNTLGGVVGSLVGTFWLMPTLGLSRSLAVLALGYLVLAIAVPVHVDGARGEAERRALRTLRRGLVAIAALWSLAVAVDLQPEVNAMRERPDQRLLLYRDTPSATLAIYEDAEGVRTLRIDNQYALSNTAPATVAMQYRLGLVGLALHPEPRRALLVGFATGTTLAAMASDPRVQRLDCVELHDEIFALAPYFAAANHSVWTHPAVQLFEGDGRRHLAREGPAYDLVVSDLFVPRNPGVGALYSVEHLAAVRRRLAPGGVFVQWLPLWQVGPDELASIARSFVEVFPEAEAWTIEHGPERPILGLVGGLAGGPVGGLAAEDAAREGRPEAVTIDLRALHPGASGPELARRRLDADGLRRLAGDAPRNTLDHPVIEYAAPRSMMRARLDGRPLHVQTLERVAAAARATP